MPKQWIQGPPDPFGLLRMGGLNPAPWDEVRQGQSAPPVGPPLDTERYPDNVPLDPGRPSWGLPTDEGERELQVSDALETVYRTYPTLREYGIQVRDLRDEDSHGKAEFSGMNESGPPENLRPETDRADEGFYAGKWNPWIKLYRGAIGEDLPKLIHGEMLHHLADPDETRGIAPAYRSLVEDFEKSLTEKQHDQNTWVYDRRREEEGEDRPFDKYWKSSARDELVRGYLSPDARDELRRQDFYTDEQIGILDRIRSLLRGEKG